MTRVVCKGSGALGILHEYEEELEMLEALLAQRWWRRGRRGKWYERRALILMTHMPRDEETRARAYAAVVDSLADEDTSLGELFNLSSLPTLIVHDYLEVYRPKLERRLTQLEKKLKIPEEERHTCEANLKKPERIFIEGVRVYDFTKGSKLNLSLKPSNNSVKGGPPALLTHTSLDKWSRQMTPLSEQQEEVSAL